MRLGCQRLVHTELVGQHTKAWFRLGFRLPIHHYRRFTLAVLEGPCCSPQAVTFSEITFLLPAAWILPLSYARSLEKTASVLMNQQPLFRHRSPRLALVLAESLPWQMEILAGGHPSDLCHADGLEASFVSLNMKSLWYHKDVTSSWCGSA